MTPHHRPGPPLIVLVWVGIAIGIYALIGALLLLHGWA